MVTKHSIPDTNMSAVMIDTREICKLMDELERDIQSSDWWYGGGNGRTLQDVWNSRSTLGDDSHESIRDAYRRNGRIVFQYFNLMGDDGKSAVGVKTVEEYLNMWRKITAVDNDHLFKPFLVPKMIYERTFRFSRPLLDHVGPSLEHEINQMHGSDLIIEPFAVGKLIAKLANRNDCMVLLAFKSFSDVCVAQCGHALIIDCIPTLESLEQNFQETSRGERSVCCDHCQKPEPTGGPSFAKCSRCKSATYCSRACQKSDWRNGHKMTCKAPDKKK